MIRRVPAVLLAAAALSISAVAADANVTRREFTLPGDRVWTDTGIDLAAGDSLKIEVEGGFMFAGQQAGPDGRKRGWLDMLKTFPLNDAAPGAAIGRIGDSSSARPFLIGPRRESKVPIAGRLFLGSNLASNERPSGSFKVVVERTAGVTDTQTTDAEMESILTLLTQQQLDAFPRRVVDAEGTEGDRLNFVIVGSEDKVKDSLARGGWIIVDRTIKDSIFRGGLATLSKQGYVTIPMSELLMFNRPQDYGYAQADPVKVVAARHHFRIWKSPITLGGRTVWTGAGTHDVGFDKDQRNGKLTHKIDPEVDKERDYIGRSMFETGMVAKLDYMMPANPVKEAKTAHGQSYYSDGRTLVIYMKPDLNNVSKAFGDVFCSVLKQNNPDGGDWGACPEFINTPGRDDLKLDPISNAYRVLVVPGIFSSCASDAPAFMEGRESLKKQGVWAELLDIPNDSTEVNARLIADHIAHEMRGDDKRKFILVGYSKGTPDIQTALALHPELRSSVAAFVAVAGASGGSPIAASMPAQAEIWLKQANFGNCKGDLSTGFKSLSQELRRAFLGSYPDPFVPTYSLPAVADETRVSKMMKTVSQLMAAYDKFNDGQLTKPDSIVPGSKYLGSALSDHLSVALPFDKVADGQIKSLMDKARYPRGALLESIVRMVTADLGAPPPTESAAPPKRQSIFND